MQRMIFQADEELLERLRRHAHERGVSIAQVIRDALDRELDDSAPPPLTSIGLVDGPGDLAERVDRDYEPDPWRS